MGGDVRAVSHRARRGRWGERRSGRKSAGVRFVNEAVVVKGRDYQENVFGGFRRSTILGCYDNRGGGTAAVILVVVAAAVTVVGVVTEVRKRKAKSRAPVGRVISSVRPYVYATPALVANP